MEVDGAKLSEVVLSGKIANRFSDLALCIQDLSFCKDHLYRHRTKITDSASSFSYVIWCGIIVKFITFFTSSQSRSTLDVKTIFPEKDGIRAMFQEFKDIRDKHIAHDVNGMMDAKTLLILDQNGQVVEVRCRVIGPTGMRSDLYDKLVTLVDVAILNARAEMAACKTRVFAEARSLTSEQRKSLPPWSYDAASGMFGLNNARPR